MKLWPCFSLLSQAFVLFQPPLRSQIDLKYSYWKYNPINYICKVFVWGPRGVLHGFIILGYCSRGYIVIEATEVQPPLLAQRGITKQQGYRPNLSDRLCTFFIRLQLIAKLCAVKLICDFIFYEHLHALLLLPVGCWGFDRCQTRLLRIVMMSESCCLSFSPCVCYFCVLNGKIYSMFINILFLELSSFLWVMDLESLPL